VFLAGSIEMGSAEDWQACVSQCLQANDIVILNPRRDVWHSTWERSVANPHFREQVDSEMAKYLDDPDLLQSARSAADFVIEHAVKTEHGWKVPRFIRVDQ
jgi:hypothetical protein